MFLYYGLIKRGLDSDTKEMGEEIEEIKIVQQKEIADILNDHFNDSIVRSRFQSVDSKAKAFSALEDQIEFESQGT